MSQNLAELLELLVEDLYGSLASTVLATLARHGRLTLQALTQSSGLSPRLIKHGLVILIQQHLVFHHTERRDGLTYYEADLEGCYTLVRFGKILEIVRIRFGETGVKVISNLLVLGHASVGDLVASTLSGRSTLEDTTDGTVNGVNLTNGTGGAHHENRYLQHYERKFDEHPHAVIFALKEAGIVDLVSENSFASDADIQAEAVNIAREAMPDHKAPRGKKEKEKHDKIVNSLKRRWRDSDANGLEDASSARKRQRTNGVSNGINDNYDHHYEGAKLKDDVILKLSRDKINVMIRARRLADLAARSVGEVSARVYGLLLDAMAERQHRCFEHNDDPLSDNESDIDDENDLIVTSADLIERIPADLDISRGIAAEERPQFNSPTARNESNSRYSNTTDMDDPGSASLLNRSLDDTVRVTQITRHLDILATSTYKFVRRVGNSGGGQYKVNFHDLCTAIVQLEVEDNVTSRFGNEAARLVRILAKKGKLDEKQLSVLSLIRSREVKGLLLELQQAGFVDLQEVPRDAGRVPSRTIYLYFFDRDRVRRKMLDDTYKVMARLLQRSKVERERLRLVIEKAERTDVKGHEDKYLTAAEREDLSRWTEREERLLVALGRCDDVVAAFRDFLPGGEEP